MSSREIAVAAGLKFYRSSAACRRGHNAKRRVSNRACIECERENHRIWDRKNKARARHKCKQWYSKNRAYLVSRARERRIANPENAAAADRRWRKKYPEKARIKVRRAKAKRLGAPGNHTAADIREILNLQRGRCAYCRVKLKGKKKHVDHITALKNGGTNDRSNLQITCQPCNQAKHAKDPIDHARSIGLLL